MNEMIEQAGAVSFFVMPIVLIGFLAALLAVGLSVLTIQFRAAVLLASVAAGLALFSLVSGVVASADAQRSGFKAVAMASPQDSNVILNAVIEESKSAVKLVSLVALPLLLLSGVSIAVAFVRTKGSRHA
jgi:hypothetical protein